MSMEFGTERRRHSSRRSRIRGSNRLLEGLPIDLGRRPLSRVVDIENIIKIDGSGLASLHPLDH